MTVTGTIKKLKSELKNPIQYQLPLGKELIPLNPFLGNTLTLEHTGNIHCIACGRATKKSFSQGYCYPCFMRLPECDMCILKPEQCHYHLGTCRDPSWGEAQCMQTHYVYLANTSGLKVGITRATQVPTRWIDQGATQALPIFKVSSRRKAGLVEVILKKYVADKTNWRAIIKGVNQSIDLAAERDRLFNEAEVELAGLIDEHDGIEPLANEAVINLEFPVLQYAEKVTSHNFDKNSLVTGTLMGIKGQYLIFDSGVINLRKFGGYEISINV